MFAVVVVITFGCGIFEARDERLEKGMFLYLSSIVGWSSCASKLLGAVEVAGNDDAAVVTVLGAAIADVVTGVADGIAVELAFELSNFFNKTF